MAKELVSTRIAPELKKQIVQEAGKGERTPGWLLEKLIQKGWEAYKAEAATVPASNQQTA